MTIEDHFGKFQQNFEQVTLTLIGNMNKITETLDRISAAMDMTDKIKIQNVENKQILNHLEKQVKSLVTRLDRMSRGGFEIPEAPVQQAGAPSASMDSIFDTVVSTKSEPVVDDLEAEFGPLDDSVDVVQAPADPPAPELPPTPAPADPPAPELPPTPAPAAPPVPKIVPASQPDISLTPMPQAPAALQAQQSFNAESKSPGGVLNTLLENIKTSATLDQVGNLIMGAKEALAKMIPFSSIYFEMLMLAGPWKNATGKPVSADTIQKCTEKIGSWSATL